MLSLADLWLPILVSAVAVFVVSFIAWMVLPHHRSDWAKVPDEQAFGDALTSLKIQPGQYMFPHCGDPESMKSEEFKKRWEAGPRGSLFVWGGVPNMGLNLLYTFLFFLVVSILIGYVGSFTLQANPSFKEVFRLTSVVGVLAYCAGGIPNAIWFKKKLSAVRNDIFDGILEALAAGAIFAWLWPAAMDAAVPVGG